MPGRASRYSPQQNSQMTFDVMEVLAESPISMNISQICDARISLHGVTSQKMARILNHLCEMNLVKKGKSKNGRMMYMATTVMKEQGFDV